MMKSSIEKLLQKDGEITYKTAGTSMWPMLSNHYNHVVIKTINRSLAPGDVILFRRKSGQLVLHRLVKLRGKEYVFRGDNQTANEYGITDECILGILKGFFRKNKYIDCENNKFYKIYVFVWKITFVPRVVILHIRKSIKTLFRGVAHLFYK